MRRGISMDVTWDRILPSWLLVTLQLGLAAVLIATTRLPAGGVATAIGIVLLAAAAAVGIAALAVNRPGNFNIRPELKAGARLACTGIYRRIRHPMYAAFLLGLLAFVVADARAWRMATWLVLLGVLVVKMRREEQYLAAAFPEYRDYAARTDRLVPGVF